MMVVVPPRSIYAGRYTAAPLHAHVLPFAACASLGAERQERPFGRKRIPRLEERLVKARRAVVAPRARIRAAGALLPPPSNNGRRRHETAAPAPLCAGRGGVCACAAKDGARISRESRAPRPRALSAAFEPAAQVFDMTYTTSAWLYSPVFARDYYLRKRPFSLAARGEDEEFRNARLIDFRSADSTSAGNDNANVSSSPCF